MLRWLLGAMPGLLICYVFVTMLASFFRELFDLPPWLVVFADWHGFFASLTLAATCSGLTVALMSLDRLQLQHSAEHGDRDAQKVLLLRQDANRLLSTLIWTNVFAMTFAEIFLHRQIPGWGSAFLSVFVITIVGELFPIALLTRYGLKLSGPLAPAVVAIQRIMWPVAKPSAMVLDAMIGKERFEFLAERFILWVLRSHAEGEKSEIGEVEGRIAANALLADEIPVAEEGEVIDKKSIISVKFGDAAQLIHFLARAPKPFLHRVHRSRKKWVILTYQGKPKWVLDAMSFLASHLMDAKTDVVNCLHEPLVMQDPQTPLAKVLAEWEVHVVHPHDDRIHRDVAIVWPAQGQRRIITGADILGRLTRGVVKVKFVEKA